MSEVKEYVIKPPRRFSAVDWGELWRYRDLFLVFTWREVSVRYKQTVLGAAWAILQPLVTLLIFTFVFNRIAKIDSGDGTPYPVFLCVGVLFWQYFLTALTNSSNSLVSNAGLVQKVYFPRLLLPASVVASGLIDLAVSSLILAGLMAWYRYFPLIAGISILPWAIAIVVFTTMGLGLTLASLNIKYRDVRYALPFFIQILLYFTPVIYPITFLDKFPIAKFAMVWLNPIAVVITNMRAGLFGAETIDWGMMLIASFVSVIYFLLGLYYFRSAERYFADIV